VDVQEKFRSCTRKLVRLEQYRLASDLTFSVAAARIKTGARNRLTRFRNLLVPDISAISRVSDGEIKGFISCLSEILSILGDSSPIPGRRGATCADTSFSSSSSPIMMEQTAFVAPSASKAAREADLIVPTGLCSVGQVSLCHSYFGRISD
jgi:hypothetical protein